MAVRGEIEIVTNWYRCLIHIHQGHHPLKILQSAAALGVDAQKPKQSQQNAHGQHTPRG